SSYARICIRSDIHTSFYKIPDFKTKSLGQAILVQEHKWNYKDDTTARKIAINNFVPALFHLGEMNSTYRNAFNTLKPQFREAISLYLKALLLISGLTVEKAEEMFKVDSSQFQYWKEISLDFIE